MSNDDVLGKLEIKQANRWYMYRWGADGPPVAPEVIVRSSANRPRVGRLAAGFRARLERHV
jgi:hypothetical protein